MLHRSSQRCYAGSVMEAASIRAGDRKPVVDLDARGVSLVRLTLEFGGAPFSPDKLAAKNARVTQKESGDWWATLTSLPVPLGVGATYGHVQVHSHAPEHDETHWELSYFVAPDQTPPKQLTQISMPGDYPNNILELFVLGGFKGAVDMSSRASYLVSNTIVDPLWPSNSSSPLSRDGSVECEMALRTLTWDVTGLPSITRITLDASDYDEISWLHVRGEHCVILSPGVKDEIDNTLWSEVARCLTASQNAPIS